MRIGEPVGEAQRRADQAALGALTGARILAVRYVDLAVYDAAGNLNVGAAVVQTDGGALDAADHGIELVLDGLGTWSIAWQRPGAHEGLLVVEAPLVGAILTSEADVAVHDVIGRWAERGIDELVTVFQAWGNVETLAPLAGLAGLTLVGRSGFVEIGLAELAADGRVLPSADGLLARFGKPEATAA